MSGNGTALTVEQWQAQIAEHFGAEPELLIPVLQFVQNQIRYLPQEAITATARHLRVSEARVFGVASFYAQFRLTPVGEHIVKVCHGTACHVGGARGLTEALEDHLAIKSGETTGDMKLTIDHVACVGCCSLAPVVVVDEATFGRLDRKKVVKLADDYR